MSSIGPQIPSHLLAQFQRPDNDSENGDDSDSGPQPNTLNIGPEIPTHFRAAQRAEPEEDATRQVILGPSFPMPSADDSDEDIGPKPLAAGYCEQPDPVKEFMEKEEKRRKAAEEALKPKAPKRDEWMLVPPTASSLLGNLDPTKLKGRQFSRGNTTQTDNDMSLWTETPAQRQQRLLDEVQGKKRRATDGVVEDEEELARKRRRKREDDGIRKGVEDYTRRRRGPALVDQHKDALTKKPSEKERPVIWDHTRDMGLGGRLMDDDKRSKMLKDAKGLGDRFNSGKSGGFL